MARPGDPLEGTAGSETAPLGDALKVAEATRILARLSLEAKAMDGHLLELRQALADTRRDIDGSRGAQLREANGQLVQAVLRAETNAENAIHKLDAMAHASQCDPLTDTPNRAMMLERMEKSLGMARRHGMRVAVLFMDLDHLKQVNDTLGHAAGDQVLQVVAKRLKATVRDSDTVSRHGGDEFLVLLSEISEASEAELVAAKILAALAQPCLLGANVFTPSASLGISLFPDDGDDAATLIVRADTAMYVAKRMGRGTYARYSEPQSEALAQALPMLGPEARITALPPTRLGDLREANAQLVLSALSAQAHEADAKEAHSRQLQRMAMVAHELRNPLTPIRVAASLLNNRGASDTPNMPRLQSIIEGQVEHMTRLVEDLLEGSRLGAGKLRMERSDIDLVHVVEMAAQACRPAMESRQQSLTLRLPPGPLPVHGDPTRLAQVLCNLLDNASKYTPVAGSISLAADVMKSVIEVSVKDTGVGISAEGMDRIFDIFTQEEHALALDNRGMGIGLAVVRELVEAHGGTVLANSAGKNQGSCFVVTLPKGNQLSRH